ncbi:MAG: site-specific integrase, partial [Kiloniellaceae bacterium]
MAEPGGLNEPPVAADLGAAIAAWQSWLGDERRASPHTLAAYRRDLGGFVAFLATHLGGPPALADLARLGTADFRAWLAARAGAGLNASSRARGLSVVRGFFRWLAREGLVDNLALAALRTPRVARPAPRALGADEAMETPDAAADLARAPWIGKRDAAVLTLLYGCGLRIGEALALTRAQAPAPGQVALRVTGKGRRQREVPILPVVVEAVRDYLASCPFSLPPAGPLFVGARGGPLGARRVQARMAQVRVALGLPPGATPHALR